MVFAVLGLSLSHFFFAVQTDIEEIVEGGTAYLTICAACSIGVFMQVTFERLLQSTGNSFYAMICQSAGAIINIIFDPICIFTLGMGVAGAAAATVFGQLVGCALGIYFNVTKNHDIRLPCARTSSPSGVSAPTGPSSAGSTPWACPPSSWPPSAR